MRSAESESAIDRKKGSYDAIIPDNVTPGKEKSVWLSSNLIYWNEETG